MIKRGSGILARFAEKISRLKTRLGRRGGRIVDASVLVGAALIAAALAFVLGLTTPARFVETLTQDLRMTFTGPANRTPMIIVKMDDAAINAMRQASPCHCLSPIDKEWLAGLIATLDKQGVRAIALDYLIDTWRT